MRVTKAADEIDLPAASRVDNSAEGLLASWYRWWRDADDAPAKMPDALHVRTAMYFILRGAARDDVIDGPGPGDTGPQ